MDLTIFVVFLFAVIGLGAIFELATRGSERRYRQADAARARAAAQENARQQAPPAQPAPPRERQPTEEEKHKAKEIVRAEMERQQRAMDLQRERDLNRSGAPSGFPRKLVPLSQLEDDITARWIDWQLTLHMVPPEPGTPEFEADRAEFMASYLRKAHPDVWSLRFSAKPLVRHLTLNGAVLPTNPGP